jgi:hypothetical protein
LQAGRRIEENASANPEKGETEGKEGGNDSQPPARFALIALPLLLKGSFERVQGGGNKRNRERNHYPAVVYS